MASTTAKQMREIAELLESSLISPEILNQPSDESVIEDEDDGMMSPQEIRQYQQDMDERADSMQEASFMIMKAVRMINDAVKGTGIEGHTRQYITDKLSMMATSDDGMGFNSIPALINKLRNS